MRILPTALLAACILTVALRANAQGLEGVHLETYAKQPLGKDTLTTYRIWVDLAEGHTLQMVFGSEHHFLRIETTTEFFNDTVNGEAYAHRIDADLLNAWPLAYDSWLTVAAASNEHHAVPLESDIDGSVLKSRKHGRDLRSRDGLSEAEVREVVDFKLKPSYLGKLRGGAILCRDCAWSVLGGATGRAPENKVLVAQISTTGELAYELNVQVGHPSGGFTRYVASAPTGDEVLHEQLRLLPKRLLAE